MDLTTRYLGLELKNPFVPSASPLSRDLDTARRLEDSGASALIIYDVEVLNWAGRVDKGRPESLKSFGCCAAIKGALGEGR